MPGLDEKKQELREKYIGFLPEGSARELFEEYVSYWVDPAGDELTARLRREAVLDRAADKLSPRGRELFFTLTDLFNVGLEAFIYGTPDEAVRAQREVFEKQLFRLLADKKEGG